MEERSVESNYKKIKMIMTNQVLGGGGGGGGRKRTEVLSSMIVWNVLVLVLLVLAECVQGEGDAAPSYRSPHVALRRSPRGASMKKGGVGSPDAADPDAVAPLSLKGSQGSVPGASQDSQALVRTSEGSDKGAAGTSPVKNEEGTQEGKGGEGTPQTGKLGGKEGGDGVTQPVSENKAANKNITSNGSSLSHPPSSMSTEAVLRGFYVFAGIGAILLAYIIIKLVRIRNRRAPGKYRVLSHADDQEMFPLAAGDGEDEEIFNAAHHQLRK